MGTGIDYRRWPLKSSQRVPVWRIWVSFRCEDYKWDLVVRIPITLNLVFSKSRDSCKISSYPKFDLREVGDLVRYVILSGKFDKCGYTILIICSRDSLDSQQNTRDVLKEFQMDTHCSDDDTHLVQEVCFLVSQRGSFLLGTGINSSCVLSYKQWRNSGQNYHSSQI